MITLSEMPIRTLIRTHVELKASALWIHDPTMKQQKMNHLSPLRQQSNLKINKQKENDHLKRAMPLFNSLTIAMPLKMMTLLMMYLMILHLR